MIWAVVRQVFSTLLELIQIGRLSEQENDLEILVLRKQLAMMEQQLDKPVRLLSRAERLTLAVIGAKLKACDGYIACPSWFSLDLTRLTKARFGRQKARAWGLRS